MTAALSVRAPRGRGTHGLACLVALLCACIEPPARGERAPPLPLPERFAAHDTPHPDAADPALAHGTGTLHDWTDLGGVTGAALVREALEANADLRRSAARLVAAEARARVIAADGSPAADLSLARDRSKRNLIGVPIPGAPSPWVVRSTQYDLSFGVSWELDVWGRLASAEQAASAEVAAARADMDAARLSLAVATLRAWFGLLESSLQARAAEDVARAWSAESALVEARYAAGNATAAERESSLVQRAGAAADAEDRARDHAAAVRALEVLLGRYPEGALAADEGWPVLPPAPPAGMPAELLGRRPDLAAAEARVRAAELRRGASAAALYPALRLTGSAGTSSESLGNLLDGDFTVWSLLGQIVQPLWQGGRLRAAVDLADAEARLASEDFADALLRALAEVEGALDAEARWAGTEPLRFAAVEAAARARDVATRRYAQGADDARAVFAARRAESAARSAWWAARRARLGARLDLVLALGGGWRPETPQSHEEASAGRTEEESSP